MIDPSTGAIKDEYKDHPEERIRLIADRAKFEHDKDRAQEKKNALENGTLEEAQKIEREAKQSENLQETNKLRNADLNNEDRVKIENASDVARDEAITKSDRLAGPSIFNV